MGNPDPDTTPEAPRCPVCREGFTRANVVLCRRCSAPHHPHCWRYAKSCATFGCNSRSFLRPPPSAGGDVVFSKRGAPSTRVSAAVVFGTLGVLLAVLNLQSMGLISAAVGASIRTFVSFWSLPLLIAVLVGPYLTETRYALCPKNRAIDRILLLGGVVIRRKAAWRTFNDVAELEVRIAEHLNAQWTGMVQRLEVWMRDEAGRRTLIHSARPEARGGLLDRVEGAAQVLDTVVDLSPDICSRRELPPGLGEALAALPDESGEFARPTLLPAGEARADPGPASGPEDGAAPPGDDSGGRDPDP